MTETLELAARLDPRRVTVNALHPGSLLDTKMVRETFGRSLGPPESGAEAIARLLAHGLNGTTGKYFDVTTEATAHAQAYDSGARARLAALTEELLRGR